MQIFKIVELKKLVRYCVLLVLNSALGKYKIITEKFNKTRHLH